MLRGVCEVCGRYVRCRESKESSGRPGPHVMVPIAYRARRGREGRDRAASHASSSTAVLYSSKGTHV